MNYLNPLLQILTIIGLFLIDLCGIIFFKQLFLQCVLCFYIARLFTQPSLLPLLLAAFCIHLEWMILYDSLSFATLYLLPITALVFYIKKLLIPRFIYPPLILTLCLTIQAGLIYTLTDQMVCCNLYTISSFIANMIVLLSNSLIW